MKLRTQDSSEGNGQITKLETILAIEMTAIRTNAQVREKINEESIDGLIASIREVGLLSPIRVRVEGDFYVIVDGERRWRAFRKMGLETIPAILDEGETANGVITLKQYIANCQREDLNVIEKATAIAHLMQTMCWTSAQVAEKLGESKPMTTRYLGLLKLSDELRQKIASGEIGVSVGYELSQITDPVKQAERARKHLAGELSRDEIVGLRKAETGKKSDGDIPIQRATVLLESGYTIQVTGKSLNFGSYKSAVEELLALIRKIRHNGVSLQTFLAMQRDQIRAAETEVSA